MNIPLVRWLRVILFFYLLSDTRLSTYAAEVENTHSAKTFSFEFCAEEKAKFCSNQLSLADLSTCLFAHQADLSKECRQDIDRFLEFRKQAAARSGGMLSGFGGLNASGPPIPLFSYDGRNSPGSPGPSWNENRGNISVPIARIQSDIIALSIAAGNLHLGSSSLTLNSGFQVPTDLYRAEFGAIYLHPIAERSALSIRSSIGYLGDAPFQNANELSLSTSASYSLPDGARSTWVFSLFFSNNASFLNYIPIPGVTYLYKTETLTAAIGFPIASLQWTPIFPWTFSCGYLLSGLQAEMIYGSYPKPQVFAGIYWNSNRYIPSQSTNSLYRLSFQEIKTSLGLRVPLGSGLLGELQFGRAFNRLIYLGTSLFDQSGGSLTFNDDWFVSWGIRLRI
jgi:hypothetical protein